MDSQTLTVLLFCLTCVTIVGIIAIVALKGGNRINNNIIRTEIKYLRIA